MTQKIFMRGLRCPDINYNSFLTTDVYERRKKKLFLTSACSKIIIIVATMQIHYVAKSTRKNMISVGPVSCYNSCYFGPYKYEISVLSTNRSVKNGKRYRCWLWNQKTHSNSYRIMNREWSCKRRGCCTTYTGEESI